MNKTLKLVLCILVAVFLLIDIFLFIIGSFEMFPTAEQIEKGRIAYGIVFVILSALEFLLIRVKIKRDVYK